MNINTAEYWDTRYQCGETGWDIGYPSPPLKAYFDTIQDKSLKILIPGCGNAHEAAYLAELGFENVTLIDIAPTVVKRLQEKFKPINTIRVLEGDFFNHFENYDLIIEQTFFCALPPELRPQYVKHMHRLLSATKGKLAGLLFNKIFDKPGPPFGGNKSEYIDLFKILFNFVRLEEAHNSIPARAGTELFFEAIVK